jgi:hypothetical protein
MKFRGYTVTAEKVSMLEASVHAVAAPLPNDRLTTGFLPSVVSRKIPMQAMHPFYRKHPISNKYIQPATLFALPFHIPKRSLPRYARYEVSVCHGHCKDSLGAWGKRTCGGCTLAKRPFENGISTKILIAPK